MIFVEKILLRQHSMEKRKLIFLVQSAVIDVSNIVLKLRFQTYFDDFDFSMEISEEFFPRK